MLESGYKKNTENIENIKEEIKKTIISLVFALLLITTPFYSKTISGSEKSYESSIMHIF